MRPHRRHTSTVQSYSLDGANVNLHTCFLGPIRVHVPNGIAIGSTIFAQSMAVRTYFYSGLPLQNCLFTRGDLLFPSNVQFLGPTRVQNPSSSRLVQPILQDNNKLHLPNSAMRPNNNNMQNLTCHVSVAKKHIADSMQRKKGATNLRIYKTRQYSKNRNVIKKSRNF